MEASFWHDKWERNLIGFHQPQVNPYLQQHWQQIGHHSGTVLVPLCGKSSDMLWLAGEGHEIVGAELSDTALQDFIRENDLPLQPQASKPLPSYVGEQFRLWQGDFFQLDHAAVGPVAAVYDRAALIALPTEMRQQYWRHLASLLPSGAQGLLITLDYPQSQVAGPPFSVSAAEVESLSEGLFDVELLVRHQVLEDNPKFVKNGVESLDELVFKITRL